jgi:hypothetical protein
VTLSLASPTLLVGAGQTKTIAVTISRPEYKSGAVALVVQNVPPGVTATFDPSAVTGRTASSTLTITAAPDAGAFRGSIFVSVTAAGRGAGVVGEPPSFELTVYWPSVAVARGGPGSGTVTSSPAGINCGTVCTANFSATPLTLTAAPAAGSTFTGWSGACVATTPTCTFTPTVTAASNAVTATFSAPGFSVAIVPASISVPQGATATVAANITRLGGFAGVVTLSLIGGPPGLTIAPNPTNVTGESATLSFTAAASLGAGNFPITILATSPGASQQTLTLPVKVTPSGGGAGNVTFSFASCDPTQVPVWVAVQNGAGAWTRVQQGAGNTFTFAITSVGGIAFVTGSGTSYSTTVLYLNASEATSIATGSVCDANAQTGTRTLTTNALNTGPQDITVTLGGASTTFTDPAPPAGGHRFTLNNFPAGRRDLIGSKSLIQANGLTRIEKMILRRSTAYSATAFPPSIDFAGPESFVPLLHFVTLGNLSGDRSSVSESFMSTNGASESFFESVGTFSPAAAADFVPIYTLPDSLLVPGDYHSLFIGAEPQAGNGTSGRFGLLLFHASANQMVANLVLGPTLATPIVSMLGSTPNVRMRAQLPLQAAYNAAVNAEFSQNDLSANVTITAGYSGGAPATWTMDMPDLSTAGYDAAWGLKSGSPVSWHVVALGGNVLPLLGAAPVDGALVVAGVKASSPSASMQFDRARTCFRACRP